MDAAEDAQVLGVAAEGTDGGLVPDLKDPTRRRQRIAAAAAEVAALTRADEIASQARDAEAGRRLRRSEAGEPVIGRIPEGPRRLPEARAHLKREINRQQAKLDRYAAVTASGRRPPGRAPIPLDQHFSVLPARRAVVAAEAATQITQTRPATTKRVANTSDPQSRIMPTRKGFVQGYNAQIAITADQVIVALNVGQNSNDMGSLFPMMAAAQAAADHLHQATANQQHIIGTLLADAGYTGDANLAAPGPHRLIALGKTRAIAADAVAAPTAGPPPPGSTPRQAMAHRLRTPWGTALHKRRGATVEPGIGNLKKIIDRFSRRGLTAATSELNLAATAFNLMKTHRAALN